MMKPTSSILTLISVCLLWLAFVLGCASSGKLSRSDANANVERLAPLNNEQKAGVLLIVKGTDELDAIYDRRTKKRDSLALYDGQYEELHEKFEPIYSSLPKGDARMMLYNTMVGYRNVRAAWQGKIKEPHDVMMLIARLRKALLKKILEGNLRPEEIKMLEMVRQDDK
jgi:hypothetical protein